MTPRVIDVVARTPWPPPWPCYSVPRPVFITGGTQDQWADPRGQFLAAVAAGPVYRLLGAKDLGVSDGPPLDTPLIDGTIGFHYHTGGHTITPADWKTGRRSSTSPPDT